MVIPYMPMLVPPVKWTGYSNFVYSSLCFAMPFPVSSTYPYTLHPPPKPPHTYSVCILYVFMYISHVFPYKKMCIYLVFMASVMTRVVTSFCLRM